MNLLARSFHRGFIAAVSTLALAACGGQPATSESGRSISGADTGSTPVAAPADVQGANALELQIGDAAHTARSDSGGASRGSLYGVDEVETLILEVLNAENTVYVKADLYLAPGAPIEGEYSLGHLGAADVRYVPGRGQVLAAIEVGDERQLRVSGDGSLRIERDGNGLLARFSYSLNAFTGEPLDVPVSGELRIAQAP